MKNTLIVIAVIIGILGLTWIFQGNNFFLYKMFAPKPANVQRQVLDNSDWYKRSMEERLTFYRIKFNQADSVWKKAIADLVLQEVASYPVYSLQGDLRNFVDSLKKAHAVE